MGGRSGFSVSFFSFFLSLSVLVVCFNVHACSLRASLSWWSKVFVVDVVIVLNACAWLFASCVLARVCDVECSVGFNPVTRLHTEQSFFCRGRSRSFHAHTHNCLHHQTKHHLIRFVGQRHTSVATVADSRVYTDRSIHADHVGSSLSGCERVCHSHVLCQSCSQIRKIKKAHFQHC